MSANVKGGPTPTMTTPLRGGYPRHPGGARELLDHAEIANILAYQLLQPIDICSDFVTNRSTNVDLIVTGS